MNNDSELLARFAADRSEEAFAALVRRYLGLVYSVALRQAQGDRYLAEDVAQKIFSELARKATRLVHHPTLGGWLYRSTQFEAIDALRTEQRRRAREQVSYAMQEYSASGPDATVAERVRPILDQAMADLREPDRNAIMLRFFEGCPFKEIGRRLCTTEDAARMRVDRALNRLRNLLAARGVVSTGAALGSALASQAALVPPAHLVTGIATMAAAGAGAGVGATGLFGFMTTTKAIILGVGLVAALGIVAISVGPWRRAPRNNVPIPRSLNSAQAGEFASATAGTPASLQSSANGLHKPAGVPEIVADRPADFAGELARLAGQPATDELRARIRVILTAWGKVAPREAMAAVQKIWFNELDRESYGCDVFAGWALIDPRAAWAAAPKTPSARNAMGLATRADNFYLQKIAGALAETGQVTLALQLIAELSDERIRDGTFNSLIPYLVKNDFAGTMALIAAMPRVGTGRINAVATVGRLLAQEFPDLAPDYAMKLDPDQSARDVAISMVFSELAHGAHARVAFDWISRQTSEPLRDRALKSYFNINGDFTDQTREETLKKLETAAIK